MTTGTAVSARPRGGGPSTASPSSRGSFRSSNTTGGHVGQIATGVLARAEQVAEGLTPSRATSEGVLIPPPAQGAQGESLVVGIVFHQEGSPAARHDGPALAA
jgi:hypothetical protein